MSKTEAVRQIKLIPNMTARLRDGVIRITRKDVHNYLKEEFAYYTDNADDAISTAKVMSNHKLQRCK